MPDEPKIISIDMLYALSAISAIAIIYTIWPKIGIAIALLITVVALGNMYQRGIIKPAK